MRVAIPIWENKISPVLDTASKLMVVEVGVLDDASRFEIAFVKEDIASRCALVRNLDIDVIICGAVSRSFSSMLTASGVQMIPGISGPVEKVLAAYLDGRLESAGFFLPGYDDGSLKGSEKTDP